MFFLRAEDALVRQECTVCGEPMKRLFPLTRFNVIDENWRPGVETKFNYNPKAAFSEKRGLGAEYSAQRREALTGTPRLDVGPHKCNLDYFLWGTKNYTERRKAWECRHGRKMERPRGYSQD